MAALLNRWELIAVDFLQYVPRRRHLAPLRRGAGSNNKGPSPHSSRKCTDEKDGHKSASTPILVSVGEF